MKKFVILILLLIAKSLFSQCFYVFDTNTNGYPTITTKFYAIDKDGKQMTNLAPSDFVIKENGIERSIKSIKCLTPKPELISAVLVMDASGSMSGEILNLAKEGAIAWIKALPDNKSKCAITFFDEQNYIIQDFTSDKDKLYRAVNTLIGDRGTDYNAAFLNPMAGGLIIIKKAKYKRIIVLISDGYPKAGPKTSDIIAEAKAQNTSIYSIIIGNYQAPDYLHAISGQTGGICFDRISTLKDITFAYQMILMKSQGIEPCEIEWESGLACTDWNANVNVKFLPNNLDAVTSIKVPISSLASLDILPKYLKFNNPTPGDINDSIITVSARNADFIVTDIKRSNPAFFISPASFTLKNGESKNLTISYLAADSGYNFCRFDIESNICPFRYYVSGGWPEKKATVRTLKLIHPNGGEVFVAGCDTVITWEGVSPDEPVTLVYRTDDTEPWVLVTDSATGLSFNLRIPNIESDKYLARVTAKGVVDAPCDNQDVELCGKIWMKCNLDVETYRNGDKINYCASDKDWRNAYSYGYGAWCYPNNDESLEKVYGKIYNWFAVNDPRGLAPEGWHIPRDDEWKELESCIGMPANELDSTGWRITGAGGKLKATGTIEEGNGFWTSPNTGADDESGFSAIPAGSRIFYDSFYKFGCESSWWSSSECFYGNICYRSLENKSTNFLRYYCMSGFGLSVRCVRD